MRNNRNTEQSIQQNNTVIQIDIEKYKNHFLFTHLTRRERILIELFIDLNIFVDKSGGELREPRFAL